MLSFFNFKIEIDDIWWPPYWVFCVDIHFHSPHSLPIALIRVTIWWWNQVFYFLFQCEAGFSTDIIRLFFTGMGEYFILSAHATYGSRWGHTGRWGWADGMTVDDLLNKGNQLMTYLWKWDLWLFIPVQCLICIYLIHQGCVSINAESGTFRMSHYINLLPINIHHTFTWCLNKSQIHQLWTGSRRG